MNIIKLAPAYKDYIWGGKRLNGEYNKKSPYEITSESWELSCHPDGCCRADGGEFSGLTLPQIIEECKNSGADILGSGCRRFTQFPVLIKLIDANDSLSIQVHPDDAYAAAHENGSFGKTEVWYIVEAEEGARLVYGFSRDVTREGFEKAVNTNTLPELLNFVPVKKGDVFFVNSGLVHAIGKGILICEIQQNSNTTYRVYDWGRVGADGKPRPLHIQKALECSKLTGETKTDFLPEKISDGVYRVADCEYFKVKKYEVSGRLELFCDGASFACVNFMQGSGSISCDSGETAFKKGDAFFIPAGTGRVEFIGNCEFLYTNV